MGASFTLIIVLCGLLAIIALLLLWADRRFRDTSDDVVDAINALLPQTQCAQCGYPGCRPYARAVAKGAAIDLCPPGGSATQQALGQLLGRNPGPAVTAPQPLKARIDENRCIGCCLCVDACPVDAIVGAPQWLHTVIEERCTGCELCLAPCPVDCIDLVSLNNEQPAGDTCAPSLTGAITGSIAGSTAASDSAPCIRCNRCESVCPEHLLPQELWWVSRASDLAAAKNQGLADCIECGLCNQVCPSNIDLLAVFSSAKKNLAGEQRTRQLAQQAQAHFEQRQDRLASEARSRASRRADRIRTRSWT